MNNKCPNCGNRNSADASFCESCGVNVEIELTPTAEIKIPKERKQLKLPNRKTMVISGVALVAFSLVMGLMILNPFAPKKVGLSIEVVETPVAGFKLSVGLSALSEEFDPKSMSLLLQLRSTNGQKWETLGIKASPKAKISFKVPAQTSFTIRGAVENKSLEFIGFSKELTLKTFDLKSALSQLHEDEGYAFENGTSTGFDFWANHVDAADINPSSARWQEDYQQQAWTDDLGNEQAPFVQKTPILSSLTQISFSESDLRQSWLCPNLQVDAKPGTFYEYQSNDFYNYMRINVPDAGFNEINKNFIKLSGTTIYMYPLVCQPYGHD